MTKEEIRAKLRPLEDAVDIANKALNDAKHAIIIEVAFPHLGKQVKIVKGQFKGLIGCIEKANIDPDCHLWYKVKLEKDSFYFDIGTFQFLPED